MGGLLPTSQVRRFRFRFTRSIAADGNGDYGGGRGDFGVEFLGTFGVWGHLGTREPMGPYRYLGGYYGMWGFGGGGAFGVFGGPYGHIEPYRTDGGDIWGRDAELGTCWGPYGADMGICGSLWGYTG